MHDTQVPVTHERWPPRVLLSPLLARGKDVGAKKGRPYDTTLAFFIAAFAWALVSIDYGLERMSESILHQSKSFFHV